MVVRAGRGQGETPQLLPLLPSWLLLDHSVLPPQRGAQMAPVAVRQHIAAVTVKRRVKCGFYFMPLQKRKDEGRWS